MPTYGRTIEEATIELQRGNAESVQFNFTEDGSALNLTGKTLVFRAQLGTLVIRKSTGSGITVSTPANGQAVLALSATETRSLPTGEHVPFEVENFTDQVTLLRGSIVGLGGVNDD